MQIEQGKEYRASNGNKVGPIRPNTDGSDRHIFPWIGFNHSDDWGDQTFTADGFFSYPIDGVSPHSPFDLIAEWSEPVTAEEILARTPIPEVMQELHQAEQPRKLTAADIEDHGQARHVRIKPGEITESEEVAPGIVFDYDKAGNVLALEINGDRAGDDFSSYAALADVLNDAYMQAARGKGSKRHSQGKPFLEQPILEIPRMQNSIDGLTYQMMKKAQEAGRMLNRQQYSAAVHELYGVINYAAAAVIRIREIETENLPTTQERE